MKMPGNTSVISVLVAVILLAVLANPSSGIADNREIRVMITTSMGEIVISLDAVRAPVTVRNFLSYVETGAYDNTIFHRVIPGFMVQGGGMYRNMSEAEDGPMIVNEADNGLKNTRGTIAMARLGEIDSASRQFFINVADNASLDHGPQSCTREDQLLAQSLSERGLVKPQTCKTFGYAVFGHVESGMEIIDLIELSDTQTVSGFEDVPVTPVLILSTERLE